MAQAASKNKLANRARFAFVQDWSTWTAYSTAVTASRRWRRCLSVWLVAICLSVRLSVVCHVLARNSRTQSHNSNGDDITITARPRSKDLRSRYLDHKSLSHKFMVTDGRLEMPIPCLSINVTSCLRFDCIKRQLLGSDFEPNCCNELTVGDWQQVT